MENVISRIFELSGKVQKIQQGMLKRHIISISAKVRQFLYLALTNLKIFFPILLKLSGRVYYGEKEFH
jgi:hypothetical protein